MTYRRHWLLSWGGTLGNGADIWSNNIRMDNPTFAAGDSLGDGDMNGLLDGYVIDIRAMMGNASAYISSQVSCTWVKFNEIGPDGLYVRKDVTFARYLSGTTGTGAIIKGVATPLVPTYQTMCITTTTARQRGPASKGRLFVPQCTAPVAAGGRYASGTIQDAATWYGNFFTALGDEEGVDNTAMAPHVVSNVGAPGPVERITGVKVGDVPDVQRRRKNAMVEVYAAAPVSTA